MEIPIRNLYHLLLYAWDYLEPGDVVPVSGLRTDQPVDLLAYLLARATERLMKQGLDQGYVESVGSTTRIRGSIDFSGSVRSGAVARSRLLCRFDELRHDVLHNRILRTTLRQISEADGLDGSLRGELLRLYDRMDAVAETRISRSSFKRVRLDRNNRFYGVLMSICAFVYEGLVVDQEAGTRKFFDFPRDEVKMRLLFQNFVKNLLRRRLPKSWEVGGRRIEWQRAQGDNRDLRYLPTMNTDVVVEHGSRSLLIDTKYTTNVLGTYREVERIHAGHLYQLFAYLQNYAEFKSGQDVRGLLLYPRSGHPLDVSFSVMGHPIRLATLDLSQRWEDVESDLIRLATV